MDENSLQNRNFVYSEGIQLQIFNFTKFVYNQLNIIFQLYSKRKYFYFRNMNEKESANSRMSKNPNN